MSAWIDQLQDDEMRQMLLQVLNGEYRHVQSELRRRYSLFMKESKADSAEDADRPRRTAFQMLELAEEEERKRREYLAGLVGKFPALWKDVETFIEGKTSKTYAQAVELLVDLSDAYTQAGRADEFRTQFSYLTSKYGKRSALMRRIREAGLKLPE